MPKKIVKCKICEKNITTKSSGKYFRHCNTHQLIKDCLISDLSREKTKKVSVEKKEEKLDYPENNINLPPEERKPKEIKDGKETKNNEKPSGKPESDTEDEDDWGFG